MTVFSGKLVPEAIRKPYSHYTDQQEVKICDVESTKTLYFNLRGIFVNCVELNCGVVRVVHFGRNDIIAARKESLCVFVL